MPVGSVEYRRIDTKYLVPRRADNYVEVGLTGLLSSLAWGPNLIFKGPKGCGKSLAVEQWASLNDVPMIRQDCTEETGTRELIGTFNLQGDEVFFMLGSLSAAVDVANEMGGCILVLEEINALSPQSQKILNAIADYRQEISIPKIGRVFRVGKDQRIWIIGTMNPNYGGTYNINEDFRSRFEFVEIGYMPEEKETKLLLAEISDTTTDNEKRMVAQILALARETRGGSMEYALSTRDLVQFVRNVGRLSAIDQALKMLEGKYESDNVHNFRARVKSTFGVDLTKVKLY
jgi:MoxR-like ATPase